MIKLTGFHTAEGGYLPLSNLTPSPRSSVLCMVNFFPFLTKNPVWIPWLIFSYSDVQCKESFTSSNTILFSYRWCCFLPGDDSRTVFVIGDIISGVSIHSQMEVSGKYNLISNNISMSLFYNRLANVSGIHYIYVIIIIHMYDCM